MIGDKRKMPHLDEPGWRKPAPVAINTNELSKDTYTAMNHMLNKTTLCANTRGVAVCMLSWDEGGSSA